MPSSHRTITSIYEQAGIAAKAAIEEQLEKWGIEKTAYLWADMFSNTSAAVLNYIEAFRRQPKTSRIFSNEYDRVRIQLLELLGENPHDEISGVFATLAPQFAAHLPADYVSKDLDAPMSVTCSGFDVKSLLNNHLFRIGAAAAIDVFAKAAQAQKAATP